MDWCTSIADNTGRSSSTFSFAFLLERVLRIEGTWEVLVASGISLSLAGLIFFPWTFPCVEDMISCIARGESLLFPPLELLRFKGFLVGDRGIPDVIDSCSERAPRVRFAGLAGCSTFSMRSYEALYYAMSHWRRAGKRNAEPRTLTKS